MAAERSRRKEQAARYAGRYIEIGSRGRCRAADSRACLRQAAQTGALAITLYIYLIYQVGLVIIAFAALLTDDVLLTCCIAAICVRSPPSPSARHLVERLEKGFIQG